MLSMFTAMGCCSFQELLVDRTTTEQRYLCIHISIYLLKCIRKSISACTFMHSHFSSVQLFATLWIVARQTSLSIESLGKNTGVGCQECFQFNSNTMLQGSLSFSLFILIIPFSDNKKYGSMILSIFTYLLNPPICNEASNLLGRHSFNCFLAVFLTWASLMSF